MTHKTLFAPNLTIETIKKMGLEKSDSNLDMLLGVFQQESNLDLKREIVSSIGRQKDNDKIYIFLEQEVFKKHYMEVIYQMFRTTLYKAKEEARFAVLRDKILGYYNNEVMQKMFEYYEYRQTKKQVKPYKSKLPSHLCLLAITLKAYKKSKMSKFRSFLHHHLIIMRDYIAIILAIETI